jgi:SAM-dependent methyltransferase
MEDTFTKTEVSEDVIFNAFCLPKIVDFNNKRIEHLALLNFDYNNKKVLETGCGGSGEITKFLVKNGAIVTLNDIREENIRHLCKRQDLLLSYNTWDLNELVDVKHEKTFDIIVSYGTLYHLHNFDNGVKNLSQLCSQYAIISSAVYRNYNNSVNLINEDIRSPNNSGTYVGCRPSRELFYSTLKKYFKHIYFPKTIPNHPDYPERFPSNRETSRCLFVASHVELDNPNITETIINNFVRMK